MTDTIKIPLTATMNSKKIIDYALIDKQDEKLVSQYHWRVIRGKNTDYARAYVKEDGKWHTIIMHRLILDAEKGKVVHHINGDGLDNRKVNLQVMKRGEHSNEHRNLKKYKESTRR